MNTRENQLAVVIPSGEWSAGALALLALTALLSATAEMFFKQGALMTAHRPGSGSWFAVSALASWWIWPGMLIQIFGMGCYATVLRRLPLYIAFSFMSILHVLIPVGSLIFFHEQISPRRWSGIVLVLAGIWIIARPAGKMEEKIEREI